jgi:hypothetical protein
MRFRADFISGFSRSVRLIRTVSVLSREFCHGGIHLRVSEVVVMRTRHLHFSVPQYATDGQIIHSHLEQFEARPRRAAWKENLHLSARWVSVSR